VKPGGTGNPSFDIAAKLAPLPPNRAASAVSLVASPLPKMETQLVKLSSACDECSLFRRYERMALDYGAVQQENGVGQ
jgi:hypothetical protein